MYHFWVTLTVGWGGVATSLLGKNGKAQRVLKCLNASSMIIGKVTLNFLQQNCLMFDL